MTKIIIRCLANFIFDPVKVLIVSATEIEISPIRNYIEKEKALLSADILITGVGSVSTTYALTKQLQKNKYDIVLNFGIAGSFNMDIELGSVVNIVQDHFSEMGAEDGDNFLPLNEIGLTGVTEMINESLINNEVLDFIPKVCGITVNKIHGNALSIEKVFNRFHPNTESMEGAAFLYCCVQEKIACAQIRAVSNYVKERNKSNWNIPLAIENLNKKAVEILMAF
ncbi:MAG: futalosine hydrolase [Bacteroidia bacterium]|nr:futalosine hydrolase [Bacteroidia bacterium]